MKANITEAVSTRYHAQTGKKYTGQTGRSFHERYKKDFRFYNYGSTNSAFA